MRNLTYLLAAFAALICMAVSCEKTSEPVPQGHIDSKLVGEWHLLGAKAEGVTISSDIDVYLVIGSDCSFELYQKSGTQSVRYDKFTGTCTSEGNILSGKYSNGDAWGSRYTYSFTIDGLLLESYNRLEEQRYAKAETPSDVKVNANCVTTKSAAISGAPVL